MSRPAVAAAALALCLLSRCGQPEGGLRRDDYRAVFDAAMAAVHRADLDRLWPLLTERGRQGVERELRTWQSRLADEQEGPYLRSRISERAGPIDEEAYLRAARGTVRDAFRFLFTVDPRPERPVVKGIEVDESGRRVKLLYASPSGGQERVVESVLVKQASGWYVDELQL